MYKIFIVLTGMGASHFAAYPIWLKLINLVLLSHHQLRTILQRLCQIGDGARQLQDAMIGSCRQIELRHAQHNVAACIRL